MGPRNGFDSLHNAGVHDFDHLKDGPAKRHSYKRRPITNPATIQAVLDAARRLSLEHWEIVLILYMTGIEVRALSKITWRDCLPGWLVWNRPKRNETLKIPLNDPDLERAVRGYTSRPRKTPDKIDRMVRDLRKDGALDEFPEFSPMTLRVTRAWLMVEEGQTLGAVARQLSMSPALVREAVGFAGPMHETSARTVEASDESAGQ